MTHDVFRSDAFFGFFQQVILYAVDKKEILSSDNSTAVNHKKL